MIESYSSWSNISVLKFANGGDPVKAITEMVRNVVFQALEKGYSGPPFNPFDLAEHLRLNIQPGSTVSDARVIARKDGGFQIEFNPNAPRARRNFSIAHEIVHTLFPDCGERTRNRVRNANRSGNDWELEMLCNIGAAEILMPIGSFPDIKHESLTIQNILRLRQHYEVSTEALLLRAIRLTDTPCAMFAASLDESSGVYQIDYSSASSTFPFSIQKLLKLPRESGVSGCRAIGYTFSGRETWSPHFGEFELECVAIPPYPSKSDPRVVGVVKMPSQGVSKTCKINYLTGDATRPHGRQPSIVTHVVNDKARRWGGKGFAYFLSKVWPHVYSDFAAWVESTKGPILGQTRLCHAVDGVSVFTIVAQHGYGWSPAPRIRYQALASGLEDLYAHAKDLDASIHMPRLGCGHGGGDWRIVSEMVEDILASRGISVTVYDPPV